MVKARLETAVQREIVSVIRQTVYPCTVFAVPNATASLTAQTQAKLKREGRVPGIPDLCIVWPGGSGWIEVKRPGYTASAVSAAQREMHALWRGWGVNVGIATTHDEAIALLRGWSAPVRQRDTRPATPASITECFAGLGE